MPEVEKELLIQLRMLKSHHHLVDEKLDHFVWSRTLITESAEHRIRLRCECVSSYMKCSNVKMQQ